MCLLYIRNEKVYLRFVRGWEVLSLDLSLKKMIKDGLLNNFDKFFRSLQSFGLQISEIKGRRALLGLDKYKI